MNQGDKSLLLSSESDIFLLFSHLEKTMYTYSRLADDLSYLSYCGVDVGTIGLSVLKNSIPYIHVGSYCGGQAIVTGGIHARENLTSLLVMRQAFKAALMPKPIKGGVYFIPMINPDGALLIEKGAQVAGGITINKADSNKYGNDVKENTKKESNQEFLRRLNGSDDFSLWKANINGVDLNNNFDAHFGQGAGQKGEPASHGYHGGFPFSEPETLALRDFTLSVRPQITLSYHALGREIYWNFFQKGADYERDNAIATEVNKVLGYKKVDGDMDSSGGYKDWCVSFLRIPSLTVEIIADTFSHPLSDCDLEHDWEVNKDIPYLLADIADRLYHKESF